jgi:hypothetical protein
MASDAGGTLASLLWGHAIVDGGAQPGAWAAAFILISPLVVYWTVQKIRAHLERRQGRGPGVSPGAGHAPGR